MFIHDIWKSTEKKENQFFLVETNNYTHICYKPHKMNRLKIVPLATSLESLLSL